MKRSLSSEFKGFISAALLGVFFSVIIAFTTSADTTNCIAPPAGLVSWWRAEANALDEVGGNNGTLYNGVGFTSGEVGQAFIFNGTNSYVEVPDSPALRLTNQLTIEFWVKRQQLDWPTDYLLNKGGDWTHGVLNYGVAFGGPQYNYTLHFLFAGGDRGSSSVPDLGWHHCAIVARRGDVDPTFYLDGVPQPVTFRTGASTINLYPSTEPLRIGAQLDPAWNYYSKTMIDEMSIYSRALGVAEIQAIYSAERSGKCGTPSLPFILTQPANQTVTIGASASFTVAAGGTPPLGYQWQFNGTNIGGATGSVLMLTNVQVVEAGNYAVQVTNSYGSTISSNAVLTVNQAPPCVTPPASLVSWWRAEANALDEVGGNNGTLYNGVGFTSGEVGQAFIFNGTNSYVEVPDSPALRLTNQLTIEFWVKRQQLDWPTDYLLNKGGDWTHGVLNYGVAFGGPQYNYTLHFLFAGGDRGSSSVPDLGWHHCAIVAHKGDVDPTFYLDGVPQPVTFRTGASTINLYPSTEPLRIGAQLDPAWNYYSKTMIDEMSIYSRALGVAEIQAIYSAGRSGKCATPSPPLILTQPANQTVTIGASASFTVAAGGTPPLGYQWQFNGTNIGGATGSVLLLTNVQVAEAGNYAAQVTNSYGSTNSAEAVLTVVTPPPCAAPPAGLVSWWRADGDATDTVARNNGTLQGGAAFALGEVGQAFSFNPASGTVIVPDSSSLRLTNQLTIEAWINTRGTNTDYGIVSKVGGAAGNNGYQFALSGNKLMGLFNSPGQAWPSARILSGPIVTPGVWHHVAWTYDQSAMKLYFNGQTVATNVIGAKAIAASSSSLRISGDDNHHVYFDGLIDEPSVYNRALSAAEIAAIYNAGSTGKCQEAPTILVQPVGQTVTATSNATFTVTAAGTPLLRYQWRFNGTNIAGGTDTSLILTNVDVSSAGSYSVRVTNGFGSVVSSDAVLKINHFPVAQCADVVVSAGTNCVADASINNGSFDPDGDPITVSQVPPGPYPLGTNLVTLTVTDIHGASNSCSALVIVLDRTAPVVNCPDGKVLEFQDETGAVARYSVTATDLCSTVSLLLTPPSGSLFPIGITPVSAQATDSGGNVTQCTFDVTVLGARGVKSNVLAQLVALRDTSTNRLDCRELDEAIEDMIDALGLDVPEAPRWVLAAHRTEHCGQHHHHPTGPLWLDETHVDRCRGGWVFANERDAVQELVEIIRFRGSGIPDAVTLDLIDRLVRCDRLLAVVSIQDAAKAGLNPKKVAEDLDMVAKGDVQAGKGQYANAIEHYRDAWRHALQLRLQVSLNPDGSTRVRFVGNGSKFYRIEVSTDMVNWAPVGTCTANDQGDVEFTDANAGNQPLRLYRAVEQ